jgi:hypothetical protein
MHTQDVSCSPLVTSVVKEGCQNTKDLKCSLLELFRNSSTCIVESIATNLELLSLTCRVVDYITDTKITANTMSNVPPYEFQRSAPKAPSSVAESSLDYSEPVEVDGDSYVESYVAGSSIVTAGPYSYPDATRTVHEMHLALLYLLSNPEEFQKALQERPPRGATTLAQWNEEYDAEASVNTGGETISVYPGTSTTPLPFVVFADDAEVVLPQAHTASQLFGVEKVEGIELEAAAGVPAISQLFLRWLALMPGGDHLNIIDPPGLTVMRIAGGRYRVTAAHRVVWT